MFHRNQRLLRTFQQARGKWHAACPPFVVESESCSVRLTLLAFVRQRSANLRTLFLQLHRKVNQSIALPPKSRAGNGTLPLQRRIAQATRRIQQLREWQPGPPSRIIRRFSAKKGAVQNILEKKNWCPGHSSKRSKKLLTCAAIKQREINFKRGLNLLWLAWLLAYATFFTLFPFFGSSSPRLSLNTWLWSFWSKGELLNSVTKLPSAHLRSSHSSPASRPANWEPKLSIWLWNIK